MEHQSNGDENKSIDALKHSSRGFIVTIIDGKLRWKTADGPGDCVNGDFDFVQLGNIFVFSPKHGAA